MVDTAATVITKGLRLFGIIDQTEPATATDIANGVAILNDLLRSEQADGACQYLMGMVTTSPLPAGVAGSVYTFTVGTGKTVNVDAVAIKNIWAKDVSATVNRETRMAPKVDVVRSTMPSMITRWHPERQIDGSIIVYAGMPPRTAVSLLIEYGGRVPLLSKADGSDAIPMPPEGVHDAALLFGLTVHGSYGRTPDPVTLARAQAVDAKWKNFARGQQWLRILRN
jgi:hypothetical protein